MLRMPASECPAHADQSPSPAAFPDKPARNRAADRPSARPHRGILRGILGQGHDYLVVGAGAACTSHGDVRDFGQLRQVGSVVVNNRRAGVVELDFALVEFG